MTAAMPSGIPLFPGGCTDSTPQVFGQVLPQGIQRPVSHHGYQAGQLAHGPRPEGTRPQAPQNFGYQAPQFAPPARLDTALPPGPLNSELVGFHTMSHVGSFTPIHTTGMPQYETPMTPMNSGSSSETPKEMSAASAISLLQEFVQSSRQFRHPAKISILNWDYAERMKEENKLEFRATVGFYLDGIVHHVVGDWCTSKKTAKSDVAERALVLFVGSYGALLNQDAEEEEQHQIQEITEEANGDSPAQTVKEVRILEDFCRQMSAVTQTAPSWSINKIDDDKYEAQALLNLMGVPHWLQGPVMPSEEEAYAQLALRMLWYLGSPELSENEFEPDPKGEIPEPPNNWLDENLEESNAQVERKTLLIRVQNRVQKKYSRDLKPGEKVFYWDFEYESPPRARCKAICHIPVAGQTFASGWNEGPQDAKFDACMQVNAFLDGPST